MLGTLLGAKPTSSAMLLELARGRVPGYPPGGKNYVYVGDMATATVNALTMGRVGESYILVHQNLTYRDAFRLMAEVLAVSLPRLALPNLPVRGYGLVSDRWSRLTDYPLV